jgi:hypothetical protein
MKHRLVIHNEIAINKVGFSIKAYAHTYVITCNISRSVLHRYAPDNGDCYLLEILDTTCNQQHITQIHPNDIQTAQSLKDIINNYILPF